MDRTSACLLFVKDSNEAPEWDEWERFAQRLSRGWAQPCILCPVEEAGGAVLAGIRAALGWGARRVVAFPVLPDDSGPTAGALADCFARASPRFPFVAFHLAEPAVPGPRRDERLAALLSERREAALADDSLCPKPQAERPGGHAPGGGLAPRDRAELKALEAKLQAVLPPQYQHCSAVSPTSMGSAGLKFGPEGRVAWDEIWTSFCDLALAGGPAHRGTLMEAVLAEEVLREPDRYRQVSEEIGRGIWMTTRLPVVLCGEPGWVSVRCHSEAMASWLARAITAENVTVRRAGQSLDLPAGPLFRLDKEIKNVVTAVAKTFHYWTYHMAAGRTGAPAPEGEGVADGVLLEPALPAQARAAPEAYRAAVEATERGIRAVTGLGTLPSRSPGWVGVRCASEEMAVWLLRAVVVENVLARREGEILYLPANPKSATPDATRRVVEVMDRACRYWDMGVAMECGTEDRTPVPRPSEGPEEDAGRAGEIGR